MPVLLQVGRIRLWIVRGLKYPIHNISLLSALARRPTHNPAVTDRILTTGSTFLIFKTAYECFKAYHMAKKVRSMFTLAKVSAAVFSMARAEMGFCDCAVWCFATEFNLRGLFILAFVKDWSQQWLNKCDLRKSRKSNDPCFASRGDINHRCSVSFPFTFICLVPFRL